MTIKEIAAYLYQLDSVIEWCKCEELKAHYRDERKRVNKIRCKFMIERMNEYLADMKGV